MNSALGIFAFITDHLDVIVGGLFSVLGLCAQLAATNNLGWLARLSTKAHDAVQFLAGNWGYAANAAVLIKTYRNDGPLVALSALEKMAAIAPPQPAAGSDAPRTGTVIIMVLAAGLLGSMTACASIGAALGTTDVQRVETIAATVRLADDAIAVYDGLPDASPAVVARLQQLQGVAHGAIAAARSAAAGGDNPAVAAAIAAAIVAGTDLIVEVKAKGLLS